MWNISNIYCNRMFKSSDCEFEVVGLPNIHCFISLLSHFLIYAVDWSDLHCLLPSWLLQKYYRTQSLHLLWPVGKYGSSNLFAFLVLVSKLQAIQNCDISHYLAFYCQHNFQVLAEKVFCVHRFSFFFVYT